jgi:hypothetical protein
MTEIEAILTNLIATFDKPLSLRNIAKQKIYLNNLPIQELPNILQSEVKNLYNDMLKEECTALNCINSKLKIVEKKYNKAFSINFAKCTLF